VVFVAFFAGYVVGSIPWTWLIGRWKGADLRRVGTGNVGAANLALTAGRGVATIGLLLDASKGVVAALLGGRWGGGAAAAAGLGAVAGHGWPVWLRFVGGRAQAVMLSAGAVLAPWATLAILPILGAGFFSRRLAVSWLVALVAWPAAAATSADSAAVGYTLGAGLLTLALRLRGSRQVTGASLRGAWRSRLLYDRDP
jgi:glycerol-3-phosphate acyltransferase PlsY